MTRSLAIVVIAYSLATMISSLAAFIDFTEHLREALL